MRNSVIWGHNFSSCDQKMLVEFSRKTFPPKLLNLLERKTKIGPSSVKWQSSSEAHCFENAQTQFSTVKTAWKWPKSPELGLKTCVFLCIFWQFERLLPVYEFVYCVGHENPFCVFKPAFQHNMPTLLFRRMVHKRREWNIWTHSNVLCF